MEAANHVKNGITVLEIKSDGVLINDVQDLLDIMANSRARKFIFRKENIHEDFFELRTGLAGEILQKASNYGVSIGIVGDFEDLGSKSLKDFIYESNTNRQVVFMKTAEEILNVFSR